MNFEISRTMNHPVLGFIAIVLKTEEVINYIVENELDFIAWDNPDYLMGPSVMDFDTKRVGYQSAVRDFLVELEYRLVAFPVPAKEILNTLIND